jgi:NADH-quinone oxidoreductase subunit L
VGATGALLMGLVGIVQFDIKRVIAYSTMSQLGYMVAATGSSAFAGGMFHLFAHAFFKALLFLAAGSVIVALHHEQDIRKMGNLKKYMPLTYFVFLVGSLSLSAVPPFSGFYSKDAIIEAVKLSSLSGSTYAYMCLVIGAFVTALYSFRALFVAFHGKENLEDPGHVHEPAWQITMPLLILALPSVIFGVIMVGPMLHHIPGLLGNSVYVAAAHANSEMGEFKGGFSAMLESVRSPAFWFAMAGIVTAWLCYIRYPRLPAIISQKLAFFYKILLCKYGFDDFYQWFFVRGSRGLSAILYHFGDTKLIDTLLVNGSARSVAFFARHLRRIQSGYLYHYAVAMIIGLVFLLAWGVWR